MPILSRWSNPVPKCSLQQWIFGSCQGPLPAPDRPAYVDADRPDTHRLTYGEYRLLGQRVALGLIAAGLKPQDRVLVFSSNNVFFPALFVGIIMAGGVFTGANPAFTPRELTYQLRDSGARFMFAAATRLDIALAAAVEVGLPQSNVLAFDTSIPDSGILESAATLPNKKIQHWTNLLASVDEAKQFQWIEPNDPTTTLCALNYSSGTTGLPKGVEITHYNYVANGSGSLFTSMQAPDYEAARARAVGLCFLPLYHVYSQTYFLSIYVKQQITVYIMPGYDFARMLAHIQRYRITHLVSVPPILIQLTKMPLTRKHDLSSVETISCGAAPLAKDTANETQSLLLASGQSANRLTGGLRQGWGMTELTCTALAWAHDSSPHSLTAVGELRPNCAARLMSADGKTEITTPGERGELWIAGPILMQGYWRNPAATSQAVVTDSAGTGHNRWLRTGDVAYSDRYGPGALFYIVDRVKELIKVRGNQVAPAELEALLLERPDVADAAVVGVTVEGQEMPRAYIVRRTAGGSSGAVSDPARDIADWVARQVVYYKRLEGGIKFVDVIPKSPAGKIQRKLLREQAQKEVGDVDPKPSKL